MRGRACFQRPSLQGRAIAEIPRIGATPCRPESVRAVRASERASVLVWRVRARVRACRFVCGCVCVWMYRRHAGPCGGEIITPPLPPNTRILYHPETRTTSSTPPSSPCPSSLLSAPRSHPRARARARARATVAPPDASTRKKSRFGAVALVRSLWCGRPDPRSPPPPHRGVADRRLPSRAPSMPAFLPPSPLPSFSPRPHPLGLLGFGRFCRSRAPAAATRTTLSAAVRPATVTAIKVLGSVQRLSSGSLHRFRRRRRRRRRRQVLPASVIRTQRALRAIRLLSKFRRRSPPAHEYGERSITHGPRARAIRRMRISTVPCEVRHPARLVF